MINQLRSLIKRAFQSASLPDSGKYSVGQTSYFGKTSNYEQIFPYGYSASPPVKTEILLFNVMGQEQNLAGIPYGTSRRFKNLKSGEVMLGNPIKNTSIKFDEFGNIIIETSENDVIIKSAKKVTIEAVNDIDITSSGAKVNIQSATEVNITADSDINLTSAASITITATTELKLQGTPVTIIGDTDIAGNLTVSGNITDVTTKTMASIISSYNAHTHEIIVAAPGQPTTTTSNPV